MRPAEIMQNLISFFCLCVASKTLSSLFSKKEKAKRQKMSEGEETVALPPKFHYKKQLVGQ